MSGLALLALTLGVTTSAGSRTGSAPGRGRLRRVIRSMPMILTAICFLGLAILLVPRERPPCRNVGPVVAMNCGVTR